MFLFIPKETPPENRVSATPQQVQSYTQLGLSVIVEADAGKNAAHRDEAYTSAGAQITNDRDGALSTADIVLRVLSPSSNDVAKLKPGALHISFLDPFNQPELVAQFARQEVSAISMEMMPRTTLAQKMDAISSQANLAGYMAVILGAERLPRILPMMMTPAGTIAPAKVFVIGVGVAGLQAIATAKRLGARVEAFDTRPVVEEQVKSLGAKFLKIDLGDTGQTAQGYAKELTPEQIEKQRRGMAKACASSDIVITTAKLFGRKAPTIVTAEMVAAMSPGSLVIDLAAETGGNVEGTIAGEEVLTPNGATIIGLTPLEGLVPTHSSQVYASNLYNLIEHFWDKETSAFNYALEDEILKGCLLTHGGQIIHERFQS
jgi:NAD(P) transhydrogenase subunit alpha